MDFPQRRPTIRQLPRFSAKNSVFFRGCEYDVRHHLLPVRRGQPPGRDDGERRCPVPARLPLAAALPLVRRNPDLPCLRWRPRRPESQPPIIRSIWNLKSFIWNPTPRTRSARGWVYSIRNGTRSCSSCHVSRFTFQSYRNIHGKCFDSSLFLRPYVCKWPPGGSSARARE